MEYVSILLIIIILGIIGGFARHLQGGYDNVLGMHRWQDVLLYGIIPLPAIFVYWSQGPLFAIGAWAILYGLYALDMTWSQDYWKPLKILWRFGFIPLVIAALLHIWIIVLVGPVLCLTTWALKKYQKSLPVVPKIFNWWEDYWECFIGAFSAIGINTAIFFGNIDYILNWSFK